MKIKLKSKSRKSSSKIWSNWRLQKKRPLYKILNLNQISCRVSEITISQQMTKLSTLRKTYLYQKDNILMWRVKLLKILIWLSAKTANENFSLRSSTFIRKFANLENH